MLKNNRGIAGIFLVGLIAIGIGIGSATYETSKSGQLKKNGQSIWAHVQGLCTGNLPDARCIN